jgi:DNA-binding protein H-NS
MKREEIVRRILALSPQTGLPDGEADAYAAADLPALVDLLRRLESISSSGRALRNRLEVPVAELSERIAEVRARREAAVERLSARLDRLEAPSIALDEAAGTAQAAVAATVAPRGGSLQQLMRQREELERQIEALRSQDHSTAVAQVRRLMADYGLTPADLPGLGPQSVAIAKAVVDPKTGKTWSGRGRRPKWVIEMELSAQTTRR